MSEQQENYRTKAEDSFKLRLLAEERELRERLTKLTDFIMTDKFKDIDPRQREWLGVQSKAMEEYHYCLCVRLQLLGYNINQLMSMGSKKAIFEGLSQAPKEKKKERLYIGCKIIKATPMSSNEYSKLKGDPDHNAENTPGYKVEYTDGYISWSPKWVFEEAYIGITEKELRLLNG